MERKPSALTRRVALFEREVRYRLSASAVEILFETAEVLSEGERRDGGYFGSTMITFDLGRLGTVVRESCDAASARHVAELAVADQRVRARARALAAADAALRAGAGLADVDTEFRARAVGTRIHFDIDVEAAVAKATPAATEAPRPAAKALP
jgi:hypothetical protein